MGSSNPQDLGNGGEISGDLTVTGSLNVGGSIGLTLSEVIQGTSTIDVNNTEAFLVRKDGDGGDVFKVDSTNATIYIQDGIGTLPSLFGGHQLVLQNNNDSGDQSRLALISGATGYSVLDFGDASDVDAGGIAYQNHASDDLMTLRVNATDFVYIKDSGVGIGAVPTNNLHIEADSGDEGITIHSAGDTGNAITIDANRSSADAGIGTMLGKWNGTLIGYMGFFSGADTTNKDDGVIKFATTPSGGSATVAMTINSSQKIGIGTGSPSGKLTLSNGSASAPLSITASNSYIQLGSEDFGSGGLGKFMIGFGYTDVLTNTNAPAYIGFEETSTSGDTKGDLTFYTRNVTTDTLPTQRMVISDDGNIGIGLSNPSDYYATQLVVSAPDNGGMTFVSGNTGHASGIFFADGTTGSGDSAYRGQLVYDHNTDSFGIWTAGTNSLMIDSSQNVQFQSNLGIGVSPSSKLHINVGTNQNLEVTSVSSKLHLMGTNDARNANIPLTLGFTEYDFEGASGSTIRLKSTNTNITGAELVGKLEAYISDASGNLPGVAGSIDWTTNGSIDGGSTKGTNFTLKTYLESAGLVTAMTALADGNIGIGSVNPVAKLVVSDGGNAGIELQPEIATDTNRITNYDRTASAYMNFRLDALTQQFLISGSEKMRLDTNGNLAIGSDSPIAGGGSKTVLTISDSTQSLLVFEDTGFESSGDGLGMFAYNDGTLTYRTASRSGTDFTGSTNRLVIDANSRISLSNNDSGSNNTIFGKNAGLNLDAGSNYNVFIGENVSDASMNDALYNVGVGYDALTALTSGRSNIAVGAFSLADNTTARFNTAIGGAALQRNTDGEHNTALGYVAGKFSAAGASNVTSPDQCTIIGSLTEFSSATPTNQIVIGYGADGLADNSVTLGNSDITAVYMAQDGGATVHLSNINFTGQQSPSGDANNLDDYEEGTWTPILSDGTNNFTMVSNQNGRYTKIGRVVHFEAECGTSSIGSASGNLKLIGLPFTSASSTSEGSCSIGFLRAFNYSADTIQLMAQVNGGTTEIAFTASKDDTTEESVQCSQADSSSFFIRVSGTYFV